MNIDLLMSPLQKLRNADFSILILKLFFAKNCLLNEQTEVLLSPILFPDLCIWETALQQSGLENTEWDTYLHQLFR